MAVTSKTIIIDKGWNAIKIQIDLMKHSHTKAGLPQESEPKGGKGNDKIEKMSELVIVGAVQEFGAPNKNIPARPFMRTAFDENIGGINQIVIREYDKILKGTSSVIISLGRIGAFMVGKTQKKIVDIKSPPNAPRTIAKKKSTNPLIDTGQMRQSIQHVEVIK